MTQPSRSAVSVPICGIGASAGGLEALQQFFTELPADLGLAYAVVMHLAPDHRSELPAILRRWTAMPVIQVTDHERVPLVPNQVYVIAPDRKLEIADGVVGASPFEQPRGHRTTVDLFLRSLAATHGDGFAVLLSGTGSDGAIGAKAVKEAGGVVLVQDPREAAHGDMARAAIKAGVADLVLPVRELAARLAELARHKADLRVLLPAGPEEPVGDADALTAIFDLLRKRTAHDFSKYKRTTVLRRVMRRMQLAHHPENGHEPIQTLAEYASYLSSNAAEVRALFSDLLISVTTFFRDPESWTALQSQVIGPLIERAAPHEQLRVWVPGCATGEEAYSLAIAFHEEYERRHVPPNLIVFASDIDAHALAIAREGSYPQTIAADVSDARLARYFHADGEHFRVAGEVRQHLIFAAHDLLRDPPFSRLHLISCRNLLIYLDRELQDQVMHIFRYASRDEGYLFLGASEAADEELFQALDPRHRIFAVRPSVAGSRPLLPEALASPGDRAFREGREPRLAARAAADVHVSALEDVAPPSVVIDERGTVLHLSASAARFFQQGAGMPARRVTELVRPELRDELHALLPLVMNGTAPCLSRFVTVALEGTAHRVAVLAQPRQRGVEGTRDVLVTFLDAGDAASEPPPIELEPTNEVVRDLREKLRQAEQRMESMRDEYYLANEDLRAANEELQSLNEEFRSTTEELETSKEELQSVNEELHTVNLELKLKLDEVSFAHSDLENLMAATDVATLFLDPDLHIKRFTPQLADIFHVQPRDIDRPIRDITHALDYDALERDARDVLASGTSLEREVTSRQGRTYVARLHPYRTAGHAEADGIVATFIDVTASKQAEADVRRSEHRVAAELNVMRRLHQMTLAVATAEHMGAALDHVLTAAIELHGADYGNVQLFDRQTERLGIVAQSGFTPAFLERFQSVGSGDESACGRALRTRRTVQIADVEQDADYQPLRQAAADAGYRAVQSTPLIGRSDALVGVLSVHFREPHAFAERDRQLSDVLGQQAAALIETWTQRERMRQLNDALNKRTEELEASQARLSQQAADLLRADRHREEFLAALGHELRNPMAAILSSLAIIAVGDERSRRALTVLQRQTRHMRRLIDDLLDVTRVQHGRLHLERHPVDVGRAIRAAIETVQPQADGKGLRLDADLPDEPVFVDADPDRLAQILDNLLRNALTYTDTGGVSVEARPGAAAVRITVRDTGIGIDQKDAPALFTPYQQGARGRSGGLGLGLTLVKALVEAHGGAITCESGGPGTGSAFTFTMPRTALAAPAVTPVTARPAPRRVVVVDDQRDVADMFAAVLASLGQDVRVAYDGETAMAVVREHRPEVAFLDATMPDMSGAELARRLRQELAEQAPTLVAVSGHDKAHAAVADGGFNLHVLKPVTAERIAELLNAVPRMAEPRA